jgi:hypothetical protein
MPLFLSMYLWSIVAFFVHFYSLNKEDRTRDKVIELLLLYQLIFSLGMTCLLAFIGLTVMPEYIATYSGWPSCPFQQELGNVNLAFGVLGVLCYWYRGNFWTATIIGFSVWILGDGFHHIVEYFKHGNANPGNIGINLITDLSVPPILIILLALYKHPEHNTVK